jgi:protein SCO1
MFPLRLRQGKSDCMKRVRIIAGISSFLLMAAGAVAQTIPDGIQQPGLPRQLRGVGFDPQLNARLPLDLHFHNEEGQDVALASYFGRQPVVLAFVYYGCPMLCNELERGVVGTLKTISFNPARDYQVVFVSFDSRETPEMAREKKREATSRFGRPETVAGWHFLTGSPESIAALVKAANFRFTFDEKNNLFAHASGILLLTSDGRISRYFFGVDFPPRDIRLGLVEASAGKIGNAADHVLLFCFQYDPSSARYSATILRIVRAGGILTIAAILVGIVLFRRRDGGARAAKPRADSKMQGAH